MRPRDGKDVFGCWLSVLVSYFFFFLFFVFCYFFFSLFFSFCVLFFLLFSAIAGPGEQAFLRIESEGVDDGLRDARRGRGNRRER